MPYEKVRSWLEDELKLIQESGLYKGEKEITTAQGSQVGTTDGEIINFCANNYLGLANHPEVVQTAVEGLTTRGYGMASVRFICGTQDIHKALERRISSFLGTEATLLYTSCFDANAGLFETLFTPEDAIFSDALNHASIIDGIRLCKAQRNVYRHADMEDLEQN